MKKHKYIGYKGVSRNYGNFEVVSYQGKGRYRVVFPLTGHSMDVIPKHIKSGTIKDPLYPSVLGVGCIGIGVYSCSGEGRCNTAEYEVWRGVLRRCHDKTTKSYRIYGARGVTIQKDWYNFQNFAEWYTKQISYNKGWALDKDLVDYKALEYNENTCTLVPPAINSLFTGGFKTIVPKRKDKYLVQLQKGEKCTNGNKRQSFFGYYTNKQEALDVYFKHKIAHVKQVASTYKEDLDARVYNNLTNDQWIKDYIYHLSDLNNKGEK
jgi:hypothetical protein